MKNFNSIRVCLSAPFPPPNTGLSTQALSLSDHLSKEGAKVINLPNVKEFKFLGRYIFNAICTIKECDVVHILTASNWAFYRSSLIILISKLLRKKVIIMPEGGTEKFLRRRGFFAKPFLNLVDVICTYSGYLDKVYRKHGFETEITADFLSSDFIYRERRQIKPVLLMTKALSPLYNFSCAIYSYIMILNYFPDAKLLIAGSDGPEGQRIRKIVQAYNLDNVTLLGDVDYEQMPQLYNQADILLNTTTADNFPRCLLEAFASGLVVVASDVGGIPYMIKDNDNGILVESNNPREVALRIIKLLNHPYLGYEISRNAREIFEKKYTWEKIKPKLQKLYN